MDLAEKDRLLGFDVEIRGHGCVNPRSTGGAGAGISIGSGLIGRGIGLLLLELYHWEGVDSEIAVGQVIGGKEFIFVKQGYNGMALARFR
jgi:hypothetical protein